MSIPKEPRQQMINMMYLVLTALLAMNVSKEVLLSFGTVTKSLANSNLAIEGKSQSMYSAFDAQMKDNADKVGPLKGYAEDVKDDAGELYDYIEEIKLEVIELAGGYKDPENPDSEISKMDDIYIGTNLLADGEKGKELQEKINSTREEMLKAIDNADDFLEKPDVDRGRALIEASLTLTAPDPVIKDPGAPKISWAKNLFDQRPVVAVLTLLTKFQNDVRAAEASTVEYLLSQIGATDFKVDKLSAKVIAPSSYIQQGKEYTADIFIAAFNSSQQYDVYVGSFNDEIEADSTEGDFKTLNKPDAEKENIPLKEGYEKRDVVGGMGKYSVPSTGVGERNYEGVIRVKSPKGGYDFYPFASTYEVAPKANFSVSPTKMNVLYIGVDNPLTITVSEAKDEDVRASITNGSMSRVNGNNYVAKVNKVGDASVNVSATIAGESKTIGSAPFRIKRIPDPVPTLGGKFKSGKIQSGTLKNQSGVVALLEDFVFDARFNVVSFEMVYSAKGDLFKETGKGPLITQQMKSLLKRAKPKDFVWFDNIKVRGPDGQTRKLPSMAFEVI